MTTNLWSAGLLLLVTLVITRVSCDDQDEGAGKVTVGAVGPIVKAVIKSCTGWRLNRLREVKQFIFDDFAYYHNVEFEARPGAPPEMSLLNAKGETIEFIDLQPHNRAKLNDFMVTRGFKKNLPAQGYASKLKDLHGDDEGVLEEEDHVVTSDDEESEREEL